MASSVIEIQTIEGGRSPWVAIYSSSRREAAVRWGSALVSGVSLLPEIRMTDGLYGPVVGRWIEGRFQPDTELGRSE